MLYTYKAKIIDVYDGDTYTANIDLGLNIHVIEKLRLYGCDTPEIRGEERPFGLVVRDYVRHLILDKTLIIQTILDKTGKYGRLLAKIEIEIEDESGNLVKKDLTEHLIERKYATLYLG